MAKKTTSHAEITDYSMQKEFDRPKLPTGEYSGIAPTDLAGVPPPKTVQYPLDGRDASTTRPEGGRLVEPSLPSRPDLSEEFAARDPDLDPQYVWRGKTKNDLNVLEVKAPIIYQQEKIFPRMLIEDLRRRAAKRRVEEYRHDAVASGAGWQQTLEAIDDWRDAEDEREASFYQHHQGWKNRLILGDSLPVMASLAENEQLRGKVQMVYIDPPYGIKFNSNWQPTTKSTEVHDGDLNDITREPEMVKAFRDTWHEGVHSYLGYLRDRLVVIRDMLTDSGSCFVQINDTNSYKIRCLLDEVFGEKNYVSTIVVKKSSPETKTIRNACNYLLWVAKDITKVKIRKLFKPRKISDGTTEDPKKLALWAQYPNGFERPLSTEEKRGEIPLPSEVSVFRADKVRDDAEIEERRFSFSFNGETLLPGAGHCWRGSEWQMKNLLHAGRLMRTRETLGYKYFISDNGGVERTNYWEDTAGKIVDMCYVVQTNEKTIARCLLMTTDPGDLVLDPTCGSGTTAYVAEQWGRRWITIDTSRVALAIARQRLMTAKFPYYLLADSPEGLRKEMEVTGKAIDRPTYGKVSQGFVYERVPHVTLKGIANDAEIDVIWAKYEAESLALREKIGRDVSTKRPQDGRAVGASRPPEEWDIPFEAPADWSDEAKAAHAAFLELKRKRQAEMDASIARTAETEYLYDRPYEDKKRIRVAGPFTVESLAPVRSLIARDDGEPVDPAKLGRKEIDYGNGPDYVRNMLEALRKSGVKQSRKSDRITFTSLAPWAGGRHVVAEGWTDPGDDPNAKSRRVAVAIGPEFGSVTRLEMKSASREAFEGGFDILLFCAFNFEAYVEENSDSDFGKLKVLHARMNADLHMSTDLKETGSGNPFVVFGEPDIEIRHGPGGEVSVAIRGVDVYDPKKGEVRSDDADAIDCWMLDTDYNEEAFFARQVYFPGKKDVYKAFKAFLKDDIDEEEWASVAKTESRPFPCPESGMIAVKVVNHFGDEVMKIFHV